MIRAVALSLAILAAMCALIAFNALAHHDVTAAYSLSLSEARGVVYMFGYWFASCSVVFLYAGAFMPAKARA